MQASTLLHLRKRRLSPTGRLNLGFITKGKLAAVLITPSLSGFPTGQSTSTQRQQEFLEPLHTSCLPHGSHLQGVGLRRSHEGRRLRLRSSLPSLPTSLPSPSPIPPSIQWSILP